jgi:hypothetical protein
MNNKPQPTAAKPLTRKKLKAVISDRLVNRKTGDTAFCKMTELYISLLSGQRQPRTPAQVNELAAQFEADARGDLSNATAR